MEWKRVLCYIGIHNWMYTTTSHDYHRMCCNCNKHQNRPSVWQNWRNNILKPKKKNIIEGLPNVPNSMFHKTGVYKPKTKY